MSKKTLVDTPCPKTKLSFRCFTPIMTFCQSTVFQFKYIHDYAKVLSWNHRCRSVAVMFSRGYWRIKRFVSWCASLPSQPMLYQSGFSTAAMWCQKKNTCIAYMHVDIAIPEVRGPLYDLLIHSYESQSWRSWYEDSQPALSLPPRGAVLGAEWNSYAAAMGNLSLVLPV